MTNQEAEFDFNDGSEFLIKDAPDEVLESMAYSAQLSGRSFTLAMCTGQAECPF
jgi:hypothetical protein